MNIFDVEEEPEVEVVIPTDIGKFREFKFDPAIEKAILELQFTQPTPIQYEIIPKIRDNKNIIGTAKTGSGKTAAFILPLVEYALQNSGPPQILIVAPTRELAQQIESVTRNLCQFTSLSSLTIYGGVPIEPQIEALRAGVDLIIATPGRLLDLHRQRKVQLHHITKLVIDEADIMMDMGFMEDIHTILANISDVAQLLLFSATSNDDLLDFAQNIMEDHEIIAVDNPTKAVRSVTTRVCYVEEADKTNLLVDLLQNVPMTKVLIFVRTKLRADQLQEELRKFGFRVLALHGDIHQAQRQRTMKRFVTGQNTVLIGTDVASRGLDVDDISHVINFDVTPEPEVYIHRVGRTGRAGSLGTAYTFSNLKERKLIRRIERYIGEKITELERYRFKSRTPVREFPDE
jgi:ATP-dependent RNA helicase RhlE